MPLQNRITPTGEIVSNPTRGSMMGNRGGQIHDPRTRTLHPTRRWASKQWICCVTNFKNRHRMVMGTGYTELFFLDEVTALSAGHRPCFECRRSAAIAFAETWQRSTKLDRRLVAGEMDRILHKERLDGRAKRTCRAKATDLPDGAMFVQNGISHTRRNGWVLAWQPEGYKHVDFNCEIPVTVLTPPSVIAALNFGYEPQWHKTASP